MASSGPRYCTGCLITSLLSIPTLATGIWLRKRAEFDCVSYLDTPLIVLGVLLIWFALNTHCHAGDRQYLYMVITMFIVLVLLAVLFGYTVFAFTVSYQESVVATTGSGYTEYSLKDGNRYWLQRWVKNRGKWSKIRGHLQKHNLCEGLVANKDSSGQYVYENPSPAQSGCCKPPYECGFIYRNATVWDAPPTGPGSETTDCTTWSNDQRVLCYDCGSCKAGVVEITRRDWKKVAIINIVFISMIVAEQSLIWGYSFYVHSNRQQYVPLE